MNSAKPKDLNRNLVNSIGTCAIVKIAQEVVYQTEYLDINWILISLIEILDIAWNQPHEHLLRCIHYWNLGREGGHLPVAQHKVHDQL